MHFPCETIGKVDAIVVGDSIRIKFLHEKTVVLTPKNQISHVKQLGRTQRSYYGCKVVFNILYIVW